MSGSPCKKRTFGFVEDNTIIDEDDAYPHMLCKRGSGEAHRKHLLSEHWLIQCYYPLTNMIQNMSKQTGTKFQFEVCPTPDYKHLAMTFPIQNSLIPHKTLNSLFDDCLRVKLYGHFRLSQDKVCELEKLLKKTHMSLMSLCSDIIKVTYTKPILYCEDIYIIDFSFTGTI